MKRLLILLFIAVGVIGYAFGRLAQPVATQSVLSGHIDDFSMVPEVNAQEHKDEVMPFGFNSPREPALAPDAPPIIYWNIDDIHKAHAEMTEQAAKMAQQAGSG